MKLAFLSLILTSSLSYANAAKPYFYLVCDRSTERELNSNTELSCDDSLCIDLSLSFEVKADPKTSKITDTCSLIRTTAPGVLDAEAKFYVPYVETSGQEPVIGHIVAPGMGRLFPGEAFTVEFPAEGTYTIQVARARSSVRIVN